MTKFNFRC